jgi:FtsZ-binding cell division protein ZapB
MTEELIKRLREDDTDPVMLKKAADTIEAQAAEIEELKSWKAAEDAHHHAMRAENERLKNILRDCDPESMSWLDARDAALGEME